MKHLSCPAAGRKRADSQAESFIAPEPTRLFPGGVPGLIENADRDVYVRWGSVLLSRKSCEAAAAELEWVVTFSDVYLCGSIFQRLVVLRWMFRVEVFFQRFLVERSGSFLRSVVVRGKRAAVWKCA